MAWLILYGLWIFVFKNHSFAFTRTLTVEFCYLLFIAVDYYVVAYFLIPKLLNKKGWFLFAVSSLFVVILSAVLRSLLAQYMNAHIFLPGKPQPHFFDIFKNSLLNIFIWVQLLTGAKFIWDKIIMQRHIRSVELEKTRNELSFLKAQVNPHFLFNSLNSIYGHIDKSNQTARTILLKFSELLRYQLYECTMDRVSLKKEIEHIRNYVSLQQYRKEEDLIVKLDIDPDLQDLQIAPLLLVVFIENAFKHVSTSNEKTNTITIRMNRDVETLLFNISNTTDRADQVHGTGKGIGLVNVSRRLDLLYPGKYLLHTNRTDDAYNVDLKISLS
jgi:two-component system LytT family sensor kinase